MGDLRSRGARAYGNHRIMCSKHWRYMHPALKDLIVSMPCHMSSTFHRDRERLANQKLGRTWVDVFQTFSRVYVYGVYKEHSEEKRKC